jgi:phage-related protein
MAVKGIVMPVVASFDPKGLNDANKGLGGFQKNVGKIAGLVAGAFAIGAVVNFGKQAILAAEEVATANARIGQVASSMGIFGDEADAVSQRLINFAKSNEVLLATDENIIKSTQAKLLTFKELAGTADEAGGAFDRATIAAIDLAAAGFGSAESNAVQLGKALNDPIAGISALTRVGVTFTDAQKEMIEGLVATGDMAGAQDVILQALETQVGGVAAATANASDQMALAFGNVKEEVGAVLLPVFNELVQALLPVVETLGPIMAEAVGQLTPALSMVADLIPTVLSALMPLIPAITSIVAVVAKLAAQFLPMLSDMFLMLVPSVEKLLPLIAGLLKDILEPLIPIVMKVIEAFMPLIEAVLTVLIDVLSEVLPIFLDLFLSVLEPLIPVVMLLVDAFLPLVEAVLPLLVSVLKFLMPILTFVAQIIAGVLTVAIDILVGALTWLIESVVNAGSGFEKVWDNITKFFKGWVNGMIGMFEGFVNFVIDGVNGMIRALNSLRVNVPDWVPIIGGQTFALSIPTIPKLRIPRLAEGGIVMPSPGGSLVNVAEAGEAEVIAPLSALDGMVSQSPSMVVNLTVNAGLGTDGRSVGRLIVDEIRAFERKSGQVWVRA